MRVARHLGPVASLVVLGALLAAVAVGAGRPAVAEGGGTQEPTIVYLVRHAEKTLPPDADPKDPALTAAGKARANELAHVLGDAGITRIFSTDLTRTRDTAAPLARKLALEVELYDPHALEAFAARLRSLPGRILVSGHSNTTPALVGLLGGDPGPPIVEATEYDRLYVVVLHRDGPPTTILQRYGVGAP